MMRTRLVARVMLGVAIAGALAYLYDPPWIGRVTSGLRDWEQDEAGTRYRWTNGHATFFVPREATAMTVPLRAVYPSPAGGPVAVDLSIDDRWLARLELADPGAWLRSTLSLSWVRTHRRYRRVDLRVGRVVTSFNRGVQLGEVELRLRDQ